MLLMTKRSNYELRSRPAKERRVVKARMVEHDEGNEVVAIAKS
jgi:hypothetical protein